MKKRGYRPRRPISLDKLIDYLSFTYPSWSPDQIRAHAEQWVLHQHDLNHEDFNCDRRYYRKQFHWEDPHRALAHQAHKKKPSRRKAL